jgi:hypothetical protein
MPSAGPLRCGLSGGRRWVVGGVRGPFVPESCSPPDGRQNHSSSVSIGGFLRRGRDRISRRVPPLSALSGLYGSSSASVLALAA